MGCHWNCQWNFEKIYAPCTPSSYFGPPTEGPSVSKYWHFQNIACCFPSSKEATTQEKILRIFLFCAFLSFFSLFSEQFAQEGGLNEITHKTLFMKHTKVAKAKNFFAEQRKVKAFYFW